MEKFVKLNSPRPLPTLFVLIQIKIKIRFISGNMAHKSYKLVQKQRQTEKEIKTYNIQHTQHAKIYQM